jgi:uncharacterized protein (DUF885 family)
MTEFQKLADRIIKYYLETSPVYATSVGNHDHDHLLDRLDADFRTQRAAKLRGFVNSLEKLTTHADRSPDEQVDLQVLEGALRTDILLEEDYCRWKRDPSFPIELAMYGCYVLVLHEFAPLAQRAAALAHRLRQVPRLLSDAKRNLADQPEIPKIWAEMGEELAKSGVEFFRDLGSSSAEQMPRIGSDLIQAGKLASAACQDYHRFLHESIVKRSSDGYSLGAKSFDELLLHQHGLSYKGVELRKLGREVIAQTLSEMDKVAAQINPNSSVAEIIANLKEQTPESEQLIDYYRAFVLGARQHLIDHNLVTVPESNDLTLVDTPIFARPTFPYAGYLPAAPLDIDQQGFFWVTPIDKKAPPESQKQQQRGHNKYQALVVSLHEAYPGHHLQLQRANQVSSNVRKLFGTSVFVEGWALYCEEMMHETGYYPDAQTRLIQLAMQLWRACRVVIDVGLHDGTMSFDDAVSLLVNTAKLERVNAEAEVKRYTQSPTQPMSYIVGKMEILRLRDDYRRQQGSKYDLKEFHDHLLSYGSIPIGLVRSLMLEQK